MAFSVPVGLFLWHGSCGRVGGISGSLSSFSIMSSPVSLSSTALSISMGNFRCANCAGVTFSCATAVSMASWVVDILFPVWIRVFLVGKSTSYFIWLRRSASQGERRGVTRSADLWGGTTLGVGTTLGGSTLEGVTLGGGLVGEITKVFSSAVVGVWQGGGSSVRETKQKEKEPD